MERISSRNRRLLHDIFLALGITTDTRLYAEYAECSEQRARGYLESFATQARAQDVLFVYFFVRMLGTEKSVLPKQEPCKKKGAAQTASS